MIELRERQRFLAKALAGIRLDRGGRRKDFESDISVKALAVGAIDNTHASSADLLQDSVMGKSGLHGDILAASVDSVPLASFDQSSKFLARISEGHRSS